MNSLATVISGRNNNYNLVRFLAAVAVIFSHSFILAHGPVGGADPLGAYLGYPISALAVNIFFIISGLLITRSLVERQDLVRFTVSRILRIFPGLFVALLFCVFVVGAVATDLSLGEYLESPAIYYFITNNIWLFDNIIQYGLPGVFQLNPYPGAVNGSLWTLPWELYAYFSVFFTFIVFKRKYRLAIVVVFIALYTVFVANIAGYQWVNDISFTYIKLLVMFFTGAAFYLFKERVYLNKLGMLVILGVYLYISKGEIGQALSPFMVAYILFSFVYLFGGRITSFNKVGDLSYGTYIYAFPVQQLLMASFALSALPLFAISTLITALLAAFSWRYVEKPSLNLIDNFTNKVRKIEYFVISRLGFTSSK